METLFTLQENKMKLESAGFRNMERGKLFTKETTVRYIFVDAKGNMVEIDMEKTFRNRYMEFTVSGSFAGGGSGQMLDIIKPVNKYQQELIELWNKYHLKEIDNKIWERAILVSKKIVEEDGKKDEGNWDDIYDEKIEALGKHLGYTPKEADENIKQSGYSENRYDIGEEGSYLVCDDDEADEEARVYMQNLIEELGITHISGWENYIDEKKLGRDLAYDSYYERGLGSEYPEDYLNEEPNGEYVQWSEDQIERAQDEAEELFIERVNTDPIGYLEEIYGDIKEFSNLNNYVDEDELIDYVIRIDGRGHLLNSYDGFEHEIKVNETGYYIYEG